VDGLTLQASLLSQSSRESTRTLCKHFTSVSPDMSGHGCQTDRAPMLVGTPLPVILSVFVALGPALWGQSIEGGRKRSTSVGSVRLGKASRNGRRHVELDWRSGLLIRCTELTGNRRSRSALSPPCQRLTASPSRAYTRNCRDRSIGDGRDNNDLHARLRRGGLAGGRTRSDIAFRLTCRFHSTKRVKPCYARLSA